MVRGGLERIAAEYNRLSIISPQELEDERLKKLQTLVSYHYANNAIYRNMLDDRGVKPEDIKSLSDITLLPIITTKDIIDNGGSFFTNPDEIRTFLHTSGSTGDPKIIPVHSGEESRRIAEGAAFAFYMYGIRDAGNVYATFPCGPWPSSFFTHAGGELLGPTIKADMSQPIEWHADMISRFRPPFLLASPSYISFFAAEISKHLNPASLGLELIILGGEPFGESFRSRIERTFDADVMDGYGCAEIGISSGECPELKSSGQHHLLAHEYIMEVRKLDTQEEILDFGEEGEMIVTPLFRRSIPIIRYAMGDIITLSPHEERCACGLSLPLMSRVQGRVDDMIKYGGANVYPEMFYKVLGELGYDDKFQVVADKDEEGLRDKLLVKIELPEGREKIDDTRTAQDIEKGLRSLSAELDNSIRSGIVYPLEICFVDQGKLYTKSIRKFRRFLDLRN